MFVHSRSLVASDILGKILLKIVILNISLYGLKFFHAFRKDNFRYQQMLSIKFFHSDYVLITKTCCNMVLSARYAQVNSI